jgi:sterol desaturase/sphingolipid hydroxylase (fatty acid hydroxylase superfamily)
LSLHPSWIVLAASFLAIGEWESLARRRVLTAPEERRWLGHLVLFVTGFVIVWLLLPVTSVALAVLSSENRFGLLNRPGLGRPVAWILTVVLLDLSRYAWHYAHHRIPFLWRLHRVHHSDRDLDLSTGFRAHPLESLVQQSGHLAAIALLAPPAGAVVLTECLFCFQSFFAHANAALPPRLETVLRRFFVTPDMHRIHHSEQGAEMDRNFGDLFPWWDHLFRTYLHAPAAGQAALVPGLRGLQDGRNAGLWFMLSLPFVRPVAPMAVSEAPVPRA